MGHGKYFGVAVLMVMLALSALPGAVWSQDHTSARVTRGDAEALFHALTTGGFAIFNNGGAHQGIVVGSHHDPGVIRPLEPFNNTHYCVEDWHLMGIVITDAGDG